MTDETERERTTAESGVPRSARMERAAATFDGLDPEVIVALTRQRNGLDLAERMTRTEKQQRDELIVKLRERGVSLSHLAYGLGMSYDGVVKIVQKHEDGRRKAKS